MTPTHSSSNSPSLVLIEAGLTLIVLAVALGFPHIGSRLLFKLAARFAQLARRRTLSICIVGFGTALLRLLLLPFVPIPQPFVTDDFSYLLAAETFASGRLTNPTHPMWTHFESFHITFLPTYMSMYFPGQGLVLAAGKLLTGQAWYGVWASIALMCAAICWMLYGWLPPRWALLGGMLAAVRLALFSYWGNSYFGGAVAAVGGALVLGALPRIRRAFRARDFLWLGLGSAILVISRPYEGLLVCLPAVAAVCWSLATKPHPLLSVLIRRAAPAIAAVALALAFMAYYDHRVFGSAFTPPYAVNRAAYAIAPHFLWQSARPIPVYRHWVMRDFYTKLEMISFNQSRSLSGFIELNALKLGQVEFFFIGFALLVPLLMLPHTLCDRRVRFLAVAALFFAIGLVIETWLIPHYIAPFIAGIYALLLQCMRHLRAWLPGGRPSGVFLVRAIPVLCVALAGVRLYTKPLHFYLWPEHYPISGWFGTEPLGLARAHVLKELENKPGKQLILVRYSPAHNILDDWVYNAPDIDNSRVVWARDMDPASNQELFRYYKDRTVWLVEPDTKPPRVKKLATDLCGRLRSVQISNRLHQ